MINFLGNKLVERIEHIESDDAKNNRTKKRLTIKRENSKDRKSSKPKK